MAEAKKQMPKRRFKEFRDAEEWELRKLGDVTEYKNGKGHEDRQTTSGKYELVNLNSISIDGGFKHSGKFIDDTINTLLKNDLVMVLSDVGHGDLLGRVALIPENNRFVLNQRVALLRPNNTVDPQFLFSYINANQKYFKLQGAGMSQLNISKGSVESFASFMPPKEEQIKIGNHFQTLDTLITLHQRKLDKIKSTKKAYLSEMFPAEGETKPKRRFKGFSGEWEVRKLGEIAEFNPKSDIPNVFEYVDLESVVGTEMIAHRTISKSNAPSRAQRLAKQGDLFYQTVRPYQKNNYLFDKSCSSYVFSTGYAQIRPTVEGYFLLSYVQTDSFVKHVISRCTGTSYPAISSSDMEKIALSVPKEKEEQVKISRFLKGIDTLLTLHQQKLEKLKDLKKSYLNEMFI